jgi:hypothetical protein
LLCLALSLEGCEAACACAPTPAPITPPPGAVSRDEAIAAAKQRAPSSTSSVAVGWSRIQQNPFSATPANDHLVWMINLTGTFPIASCPPDVERPSGAPPSLPPCLWKDGGLTAVLDIYTGVLIGWENY